MAQWACMNAMGESAVGGLCEHDRKGGVVVQLAQWASVGARGESAVVEMSEHENKG